MGSGRDRKSARSRGTRRIITGIRVCSHHIKSVSVTVSLLCDRLLDEFPFTTGKARAQHVIPWILRDLSNEICVSHIRFLDRAMISTQVASI